MLFCCFLVLCISHHLNNKGGSSKYNENDRNKFTNQKIIHNDYSEPAINYNDAESYFNSMGEFGFIFSIIILFLFIICFIIFICKACCGAKNEEKNIATTSPLINQSNNFYCDAVPPIIPQHQYYPYTAHCQDSCPHFYQQEYQQPQ